MLILTTNFLNPLETNRAVTAYNLSPVTLHSFSLLLCCRNVSDRSAGGSHISKIHIQRGAAVQTSGSVSLCGESLAVTKLLDISTYCTFRSEISLTPWMEVFTERDLTAILLAKFQILTVWDMLLMGFVMDLVMPSDF